MHQTLCHRFMDFQSAQGLNAWSWPLTRPASLLTLDDFRLLASGTFDIDLNYLIINKTYIWTNFNAHSLSSQRDFFGIINIIVFFWNLEDVWQCVIGFFDSVLGANGVFFVDLAALGVIGLLGLSTVPGVSAALSWDICTKNAWVYGFVLVTNSLFSCIFASTLGWSATRCHFCWMPAFLWRTHWTCD